MNASHRLAALALGLGLAATGAPWQDSAAWPASAHAVAVALLGAALVGFWPDSARPAVRVGVAVLSCLAALAATWPLFGWVAEPDQPWGGGFWLLVLALAALAVAGMRRMAVLDEGPAAQAARVGDFWATTQSILARYATPALFGLWVLAFWQILVRAGDVPQVLLPAPERIAMALSEQLDVLWGDFAETVLKAVLAGFAGGAVLGIAVGVTIDRSPFLQRGLLPLSALASVIPLVGVAPIMVMWFGFEWPARAAVVIVMTFFPMLVNTLAGLQATSKMERDLMHSYAAGYWRTLLSLRLPAALPFIFGALKINSTLALIGAIVAEFFGSPTVGMGFRISTEASRMNMGLVWATIFMAAVAGSVFYGAIATAERALTFWHPSIRGKR